MKLIRDANGNSQRPFEKLIAKTRARIANWPLAFTAQIISNPILASDLQAQSADQTFPIGNARMMLQTDPSVVERIGLTGFVFGLTGMVFCWWFPYGGALAAMGTLLGLAAWFSGDRRAILGAFLAASGMAGGALLAWDDWVQLIGS